MRGKKRMATKISRKLGGCGGGRFGSDAGELYGGRRDTGNKRKKGEVDVTGHDFPVNKVARNIPRGARTWVVAREGGPPKHEALTR